MRGEGIAVSGLGNVGLRLHDIVALQQCGALRGRVYWRALRVEDNRREHDEEDDIEAGLHLREGVRNGGDHIMERLHVWPRGRGGDGRMRGTPSSGLPAISAQSSSIPAQRGPV